MRPANPEEVDKKLHNGIRNIKPKTPLSYVLSQKKTIRFGNKTDPFQDIDLELGISRKLLRVLLKHQWTFVIQTRFTNNMMESDKTLDLCRRKGLFSLMPVISPGLDKDWAIFERKRTPMPSERLNIARYWKEMGVNVGINGEPFIPGFHREKDFEEALKLIKSFGIHRYNTYNFHFNAFVAKRIHENCPEVDIERIWFYNQDEQWKPVLQNLLDLSKKHNFILGCPDFVNSGPDWRERANTCCGIDVPNPCTFNTHYFKKLTQDKKDPISILESTWDGSGDYLQGQKIVTGEGSDFYTLRDAGL